MARLADSVDVIFHKLRAGDRTALSRAITLTESTRTDQRNLALELLDQCLPHTGSSIRVGITGIPGVGKSTFIDALGTAIIADGKKVAVLAIDPSSAQHKGSILGDKTRMERLSVSELAYIRPSASAGDLGGVRSSTRESICLCEAAGYEVILIETVGVGQSEIAVHGMVDLFLLLTITGAGDELQGIKRGIMEMADLVVVNKAEGDNIRAAERTSKQLESALHLFPVEPGGWIPPVLRCSSVSGTGIQEIWQTILRYREQCIASGIWQTRRKSQLLHAYHEEISQGIQHLLRTDPYLSDLISKTETEVNTGRKDAFSAARQVLDAIACKIRG